LRLNQVLQIFLRLDEIIWQKGNGLAQKLLHLVRIRNRCQHVLPVNISKYADKSAMEFWEQVDNFVETVDNLPLGMRVLSDLNTDAVAPRDI
jgi:hypothetical protein